VSKGREFVLGRQEAPQEDAEEEAQEAAEEDALAAAPAGQVALDSRSVHAVARPVVFLSDFGLGDEFVGICHGVIAKIAPQARVIDLAHAVPRQDVRRGALFLQRSTSYMPDDAVFLAVVDPGVGTDRLALAVQARSGALLVGPDNGVLSLAWGALGGVVAASSISSPAVTLQPAAATFHGRDVFSPAAAHLAAGMTLGEVGPPVDPTALVALTLPEPVVSPGALTTTVISTDRFGNVELAATEADLHRAGLQGASELAVETEAGPTPVLLVRTYGDVDAGRAAVLIDSSGWVTIAVNRGRADERFGLEPDDPVTLRRS
jgi:S-adenosylmethionine hydrolase